MTRFLVAFLLTAIMLFNGSAASAKWYEASSDHFVIYADDKEEDVREFANNLERYHAALKYVRKFGDKPPPSPSNRVTIFVTKSSGALTKLAGDKSREIAGFYVPRAGASVAFTPPVEKSGERIAEFSQVVLLHEYAHHFMISNLPIAFPRWYTEGFAEFSGTSTFGKDGSVGMGKPAHHRGNELNYSISVPWKLLFNTQGYLKHKGKSKRYDSFYGQSWAVFHYLEFTEEGRKLHTEFLKRLLKGESDIQAAEGAFGDLEKFGRKIDTYLRASKMSYLPIAADKLIFKPATLRELSAGEAAMMPIIMQSRRGVNEEQAAQLVLEARKIAALHPDDAAVQAALAEAEYDAGNDDAAIAAADKATAKQPKNINALIQKGYALLRKAEDSDTPAAAFNTARKHMISINKIEVDHPIPLIHFYKSYLSQGIEPNENAKTAVDYALQLSPFDKEVRFLVAQQDINDKRYAQARSHLLKLISDPHLEHDEDSPVIKLLKEAEIKLGIRQPEVDDQGNAQDAAAKTPADKTAEADGS
jgi:hypothetical protein